MEKERTFKLKQDVTSPGCIQEEERTKINDSRSCTPLLISAHVNKSSCDIVIDTGASTSLISKEYYDKLLFKSAIVKEYCTRRLRDASGSVIKSLGRTETFITIGTIVYRVYLVVCERLSNNVILGNDFLHHWGFTIDFNRGYLWSNKNTYYKFNIGNNGNDTSINQILIASESYAIPANTSMHIKCNPRRHPQGRIQLLNKSVMLESLDLEVEFVIPHSVVNSNYIIDTLIINPNPYSININKFDPIASAYYFDDQINNTNNNINDTINIIDDKVNNIKDISEININNKLSIEESNRLIELVKEFDDLFSNEISLSHTHLTEHTIDTGDVVPIRTFYGRSSKVENEIMKKEIDMMIEKDIITESKSDWSAPVVLVKKKDGTVRFCIDYRKLNNVTRKEVYPIPRIEDTLQSLANMKYFTTLDFASGYWQLQVAEKDRHKTAFHTIYGCFEFKRMPFGLCNAPYTFQRHMDGLLKHLKWNKCLVYLDDIIIFSKTFDDHLRDIREVFEIIRKANMKLKLKKCEFAFDKIRYLGHYISSKGIEVDPSKLDAIRRIAIPRTSKEVKSFLGLCSYYRRFIRGFSNLSYPLIQLTKLKKFQWNNEAAEAMDELKARLSSTPILSFPDYNREFILQTDACKNGYGAVLAQKDDDGLEHPIAYFSRVTNKHEKNYSSREAECNAIIVAVKHFKPLLYGQNFRIITDHKSLKYLKTSKELNTKFMRWNLFLEDYNFTIEYKKGKHHKNADALSRLPIDDIDVNDKVEMNHEKNIHFTQNDLSIDHSFNSINIIDINNENVNISDNNINVINNDNININNNENDNTKSEDFIDKLVKKQRLDPNLLKLIDYIEQKKLPDDKKQINIISLCNFMVIDDRALYFIDNPSRKRKRTLRRKRLVVPESLKELIMKFYHDSEFGGHLGFFKSYEKIRQRFFWEGMYADLKKWIATCDRCTSHNHPLLPNHSIEPILSFKPFELIVMDHFGPLPETKQGNKLILLLVDHFSGWVEAIAVPDKSAETTAREIYHKLICRFGLPKKILSDQSTSFKNELMTELMKYLTIEQSLSSAYRPQTNGIVERFNRTLTAMLAKYCKNRQDTWDILLPSLIFSYNSSVNATTSMSPFSVIYGREPKLLEIDDEEENFASPVDYVNQLHSNLKDIYSIVREQTIKNNDHMKTYDKRKRKKKLETKDLISKKVYVLFPQAPTETNPKFYSKWRGPFKVTNVIGKNVTVQSELNEDQFETVHIQRVKLITEEETNDQTITLTPTSSNQTLNNQPNDEKIEDKTDHDVESDKVYRSASPIENDSIAIHENDQINDEQIDGQIDNANDVTKEKKKKSTSVPVTRDKRTKD